MFNYNLKTSIFIFKQKRLKIPTCLDSKIQDT